jgi:hypothetical protein
VLSGILMISSGYWRILLTLFDQKNSLFFNNTGSLILYQPHLVEFLAGKHYNPPEVPLPGKRVKYGTSNNAVKEIENEKRPCI